MWKTRTENIWLNFNLKKKEKKWNSDFSKIQLCWEVIQNRMRKVAKVTNGLISAFRIRICYNADPDPGVYFSPFGSGSRGLKITREKNLHKNSEFFKTSCGSVDNFLNFEKQINIRNKKEFLPLLFKLNWHGIGRYKLIKILQNIQLANKQLSSKSKS